MQKTFILITFALFKKIIVLTNTSTTTSQFNNHKRVFYYMSISTNPSCFTLTYEFAPLNQKTYTTPKKICIS